MKMKIETYIGSLVSYAMNTGLSEPEDHQVLTACWICFIWTAIPLPLSHSQAIWKRSLQRFLTMLWKKGIAMAVLPHEDR